MKFQTCLCFTLSFNNDDGDDGDGDDDDGGDDGDDGVNQWVSGKFELGASVVI